MATTTTSASASTSTSTTSATSTTTTMTLQHPHKSTMATADLELHVLQTFGQFAGDKLVASYLYLKGSSRVLGLLAATTEALVTKSGLVALVSYLFAQYQRLGHPLVAYVDEAMGRRIVDAFVAVLLLAHESSLSNQDVEAGKDPLALTFEERVQALLSGQVPRLSALLSELKEREAEAQLRAATATAPVAAPVVMDLQDFVPKDEVRRLRERAREEQEEMQQAMNDLRAQLSALEREKQQLEQDLTDVHNYQESERGQRFQEMEVGGARANQVGGRAEGARPAQDGARD
ncbi:hypothetical protein ATCC90586_006087 [Pythium insidiosum]|nr:hypothetical protein ATCC90586_006087 [Pythium insidiosum]